MRLQWSPAGRQHCSHAYLGEALVTKIEQQSPAIDKALDSGAYLSTREPAAGGPQQPTQKPESAVTDGWAPCPVGLPLYPRGVGLYKPPGAPMQRVQT